jgi:hypothetical protein
VTRLGPHRLQPMDTDQRERLLVHARHAAAEQARQWMLELAQQRQNLILGMYDGGLSVRDLAHYSTYPRPVCSRR